MALLDAALRVIRAQGLHATTVDELCEAAGVTKGAFFHHFASKEDLAVAAADYWSETTGALFAAAPYHEPEDPVERVFGYLDFRASLITGEPAEFTCLVGTMTQEAFETSPAVRDACAASIFGHAETLEADLAAALAAKRHRRRGQCGQPGSPHPDGAPGRVRVVQGCERSGAGARGHRPSSPLPRVRPRTPITEGHVSTPMATFLLSARRRLQRLVLAPRRTAARSRRPQHGRP